MHSLPKINITGLFIIRDDTAIQIILLKESNQSVKYYDKRAKLNEHQGLTIYNVTASDQGMYQYGLLYSTHRVTSTGELSVIRE